MSTPDETASDEVYFTPDEVAERLRLSRRTVDRYIHSGQLEAVRSDSGRQVRIPDRALRDFMAAKYGPVAPAEAVA